MVNHPKKKKTPAKPVARRDPLQELREKHPDDPTGDHWRGVGCYIGEDVWGDPEYFGMPSQSEIFGGSR